jgi:predicted RNA-binding Zn-ribbon protein involved in translation (DUF1610 family)
MGLHVMGVVTITCPSTGQEITTGIETDEETFSCLPDVESHTLCPACGETHSWSKQQARYDGTRRSRLLLN